MCVDSFSSVFVFAFVLQSGENNNRAKRKKDQKIFVWGNYHFELPFLDGHYYTKQIKKKITTSYFPRPFVSEIFCSMLFRSICYTQQKWEWANLKRSSRPTCCRIRFFELWQCMGGALRITYTCPCVCLYSASMSLCVCVCVYICLLHGQYFFFSVQFRFAVDLDGNCRGCTRPVIHLRQQWQSYTCMTLHERHKNFVVAKSVLVYERTTYNDFRTTSAKRIVIAIRVERQGWPKTVRCIYTQTVIVRDRDGELE